MISQSPGNDGVEYPLQGPFLGSDLDTKASHPTRLPQPGSVSGMAAQQRAEDRPFRFLDLPKELRLMVYERLPVRITHHHIDYCNANYVGRTGRATLILRGVPAQVLVICRLIHDEAKTIIMAKIDSISNRLPRVIMETRSAPLMVRRDRFEGILVGLWDWFLTLRQNPRTSFRYWLQTQNILNFDYGNLAELPFESGRDGIYRFIHQSGQILFNMFFKKRTTAGVDPFSPIFLFMAFKVIFSRIEGEDPNAAVKFVFCSSNFKENVVARLNENFETTFKELTHIFQDNQSDSCHLLGHLAGDGDGKEVIALGADIDNENLWGKGWVEGEFE